MFKGVSTLQAYEQCLKRGLCESHIKEVNQNELAVQEDELPRKAVLFIRVNILSTILFKKSTKCEKIKILLQKTPIFSRILAKGDSSEAGDAILVLDSVVIFTLCQLSKICCVGALFQKDDIASEDPEIKQLQNLLFVDRIEGTVLHHLYPLLQKNFVGLDLDLIKVSYVLTLLFVRNYCVKLNIKTALETIEEDLKGGSCWENLKNVGDISYQNGNYKEASNAYTSAVMLNSYSSELFTQRAQTFLKLGKFKAAQVDAYIAVIIDPKWCEGYYVFSSSLFHRKLYQDAFDVANYGLEVCESNDSYYESLQTLSIEIEMKYLHKKEVSSISENSGNHSDTAEESMPEKKYFPELVDSDSADSESEAVSKFSKNVPELVDASDSDESETVEKKTVNTQTRNKAKKKRTPPEDSASTMLAQLEMIKIHTFLKEASEAILSDCGYKAVQIFRGPLRDFIDSPKLNTFEECEVVCIKYAYGIAYCKSGGYDDLLKCITILKEIIEKHDSVTFPAAYYALGLTYWKLNRFKEGLNYLETVKSFLSKGIHFKVYPWPEITTVIQETKPEILKVFVDDLIKECENPPNPDALCRFAYCSFQPTIYYTDPDFKGYISLLCSEQCCLQYHLQCWKTIKTEKKLTDKEFLDQTCFTPDCEGVIIKVQNIDKKGDLAKEFTSDFKKTTKQKWAKWEKKTDIKEKKKKRANSRSEDGSQEVPIECGKVSSRKNSDANEKFTIVHSSGSANPPIEKDASSSESVQKTPQKVKALELDDTPKESDICSSPVNEVQEIQDVPCVSEERKKSSNAQEIPDVLQVSGKENDSSSSQEIPVINSVSEKENDCSNAQKSPDLDSEFQNENKFNDYAQENSSQFLVSQCIKNNVYSYMSDFLQHHGPLRTDDKLLKDEMASFPDEVNTMIAECGGIGEFLKNDLRFAFVGDIYICVVSDLATAYKMNSSSSLPTDLESLHSLESTDHSKYYDGCGLDTQHQNFGLNPDALEYTPAVQSVGSKDTEKINANNSFLKNLNASNFSLDPESFQLSSDNINAISSNQKSKSKSCDTVLDSKFCNNSESIFSTTALSEKAGIYDKENYKGLSNEDIYKSNLSSKTANSDSDVNAINYNQNTQEGNGNLCTDFGNLSLCGVNKEIQSNRSSASENSKIKKIQTQLLPVLKEFCSEGFNNYRQYIDACIKPYTVRKLPEIATTGTETDFEAVEVASMEHLKCLADTLEAVNKQLTEQNLSLKNQLSFAVKEKKEFLEEVSKLKTSLSSSSFDLEVLKIDHRKKEEELLNGREYLLKSLTDAHSSIDEQKKRIELLEALNSRLQETVGNLTSSLNEAEVEMKTALEAEEKKHNDITRSLQKENGELKSQVKYAEIQFLQSKKTEYLNRIEDKYLDASVKKQEITQGLSMISGNLNPVVHSSMKTIFAQLSSYVNELNALKLEFVKKIGEQIEKIEKGASLKELKEIEMKKLPDPPRVQSLFPQLDKYLLNSTQIACNLLNIGSLPQVPSAAVIPPATASTAVIPPAAPSAKIISSANPSAAVIKPPTLATIIPQAKLSTTIIPQATPSATIIPQAPPSATIIPQATPSATIIPQASPSTTIISPSTPGAAVVPPVPHSILSSITPILETSKSKKINSETFDILNPQIQESVKNTGASINSFTSIPYSVPTLDKEFNKTCAIFRPPEPVSNNKLDTPKVPPGIINSATSSVSSKTTSSSSKDSLETFPSAERTLGSLNAASKVNEPVLSSLKQEKKKTIGNRMGSSYDKLLGKLKEQFPSYSQEELIVFVSEFRSLRQRKLTGMPIDAIIGELSVMIKSKINSEKKFHEQKVQPKPNKVLVNKKLVPDSKPPAVTEQQSVKKKSAWGTIDSDHKRIFSGNPDDDCTICCDPMTNTSAYKVACGHTFHEQCIRQWLKNKSNCPVCRVLLLLPEEYPSLS